VRFVLIFLLGIAAPAQVATQANAGYKTAEGRANLAASLDSHGRDATEHPKELTARLGLKPGDTVVDLGCGPGYMLPYLSQAVGPAGKVIGEDIESDFLDKARAKAAHEHVGNVSFVLGTDRDPRLPAGAADVVFALDVYHHFDYPEQMLAGIRSGLRAGGRFIIVEYYRRPGAMGENRDWPLRHIRLDADDAIREIEANGFHLLTRGEHIPGSQYIAIFDKVR
jgi:ubiquinone/menaquinone biosynthesis C-methylase UbiE